MSLVPDDGQFCFPLHKSLFVKQNKPFFQDLCRHLNYRLITALHFSAAELSSKSACLVSAFSFFLTGQWPYQSTRASVPRIQPDFYFNFKTFSSCSSNYCSFWLSKRWIPESVSSLPGGFLTAHIFKNDDEGTSWAFMKEREGQNFK